MHLHGKNIIGQQLSSEGENTFSAFAPHEAKPLEPLFFEATQTEIDRALALAARAAARLRNLPAQAVADFLLAIREEIAALGDPLIDRAAEETALGLDRLKGERDRTLNQIRLFADLVKEGSWVDARIDTALPDRKPLPRPDIRRMLEPIGPVAVFGASNFPLAFSVAGGDTVSAFAAHNPVVVKAHPAHPGTSELVATAIAKAVKARSLPDGAFSMLHGLSPEPSLALAAHPQTRAVAFTGSQRAGRALFDAGARRPHPIPVFAEMGSVNPVFVLPQALEQNTEAIADGLLRSVTLGVGQFCTCPGLVFGIAGKPLQQLREQLVKSFESAPAGTMLNSAICNGFQEKFKAMSAVAGVASHASSHSASAERTEAQPGVFTTDSRTWLDNRQLHEEIFGPATVLIECPSGAELLDIANSLEGTLTATIHGTPEELARHSELVGVLARKAGRLIFNGYPTGVEVGHAMHHGGPYPATTDERFTSVGTAAIYRFARPVCYQGFPEHLLPPELQDANPHHIWRLVNGHFTQDPVAP
jgi:alpha-ketoglutaric semialdehyde dehydrogenase